MELAVAKLHVNSFLEKCYKHPCTRFRVVEGMITRFCRDLATRGNTRRGLEEVLEVKSYTKKLQLCMNGSRPKLKVDI